MLLLLVLGVALHVTKAEPNSATVTVENVLPVRFEFRSVDGETITKGEYLDCSLMRIPEVIDGKPNGKVKQTVFDCEDSAKHHKKFTLEHVIFGVTK
jgi:hypothetical protein